MAMVMVAAVLSCSFDGTDDEDDDDNDDVQHDVKNYPIVDSAQQRNHRGGATGTTTGPRGGGEGGCGSPASYMCMRSCE